MRCPCWGGRGGQRGDAIPTFAKRAEVGPYQSQEKLLYAAELEEAESGSA